MSNMLPEAPSDSERERDLNEIVDSESESSEEDARRQQSLRQLSETSRSASRTASEIEMRTFHDEGLQRAQNGEVRLPTIAIGDGGNDEVENLRAMVQDAGNQVSKSDVAAKAYNLQRFLAAFSVLASLTALASLLYNAIKASRDGNQAEVPEQLGPDVAALVRQWWSLSDADYWTSLAVAVELPQDPPLTLPDQIVFMNYTMDLAPEVDAWLWETSADLVDRVDELHKLYAHSGNKTGPMYRQVIAMTYKDQPLPRGVAADLLVHVLSKIVILSA